MRLFSLNRWKATALCLVVASVPAFAFQESKVAPADKPAESAPLTPQLQLPDGKPGVQLSTPEAGKGTEVRIPGLGKLGVLPKLDFGLELLYGVNDAKPQEPADRLRPGSQDDDVKIRGSLKHRF